MTSRHTRVLAPVRRHRAERYVLISLITFAFTVIALRAILWLAGYPQIGTGTVHIAHVLWGGLGLFGASLLMLVLSNRWAMLLGASLSGAGVGLFIDEVGKFITSNNNYYTPAAAPIIYALFLATVLVYLRVRRPPKRDTRGEMYCALEQMGEVLDHRMTRYDLDAFAERLELIQSSAADDADRQLAASMLAVVSAERPLAMAQSSNWRCRISLPANAIRRRVLTPGSQRVLLVVLLFGCGAYEILSVTLPPLRAWAVTSGSIGLVARVALQGGVGLAALAGGVLAATRHERREVNVAICGLIIGLTVTNLLVLYQDQLRGLAVTVLQCTALAAALSFRRTCLEFQGEPPEPSDATADLFAELLPPVRQPR